MSKNPNTQRDMMTSDENTGFIGAEIVQPEELLAELDTVQRAIDHDESVTQEMIDILRKKIDSITMSVGGEEMTFRQIRQIPDYEKNIRIWQEVMHGNFEHIDDLTQLTTDVTKALATHDSYSLSLNGITRLTDEQAKMFGQFKGNALWLNGLTHISRKQAASLAKFAGEILALESLLEITDNQAKALADFCGEKLRLYGLLYITDKSARYLAPLWKSIECNDNIRHILLEAASRLGLL